jgi:hypothetical protein
MRRISNTAAWLIVGGVLGASGVLVAQTAMRPGHERVPPTGNPRPT